MSIKIYNSVSRYVLLTLFILLSFGEGCRKQQPSSSNTVKPAAIKNTKPSSPEAVSLAIEQLDSVFRIAGYEDMIDPRAGIPSVNEIATSVTYNLGGCYPASEFLAAIDRHLRALGWITPEYTFDQPSILSCDSEKWTACSTYRSGKPDYYKVEMYPMYRVRNDQVLDILGMVSWENEWDNPPVYVEIGLYQPKMALHLFDEYKRAHGKPPIPPDSKESK